MNKPNSTETRAAQASGLGRRDLLKLTGAGIAALGFEPADATGYGRLIVDGEGRVGPLDTVFYDTLLDENAASHLALGSAYNAAAGEEDRGRLNRSEIHVDFMIGAPEVDVTGITRDGERVPVLRDSAWQL